MAAAWRGDDGPLQLRIVAVSHGTAKPSFLDPESGGRRPAFVPVMRFFGIAPDGVKTCVHLHGVFPYAYVRLTDPTTPREVQKTKLDTLVQSLETALRAAQAKASVQPGGIQQIFAASLYGGRSIYGYHEQGDVYAKVSFFRPAAVAEAAALLTAGCILGRKFEVEAHLPFWLQVFVDFNLVGAGTGKGMLRASAAWNRPMHGIARESSCAREVDILGNHIDNVKDVNGASLATPLDQGRLLNTLAPVLVSATSPQDGRIPLALTPPPPEGDVRIRGPYVATRDAKRGWAAVQAIAKARGTTVPCAASASGDPAKNPQEGGGACGAGAPAQEQSLGAAPAACPLADAWDRPDVQARCERMRLSQDGGGSSSEQGDEEELAVEEEEGGDALVDDSVPAADGEPTTQELAEQLAANEGAKRDPGDGRALIEVEDIADALEHVGDSAWAQPRKRRAAKESECSDCPSPVSSPPFGEGGADEGRPLSPNSTQRFTAWPNDGSGAADVGDDGRDDRPGPSGPPCVLTHLRAEASPPALDHHAPEVPSAPPSQPPATCGGRLWRFAEKAPTLASLSEHRVEYPRATYRRAEDCVGAPPDLQPPSPAPWPAEGLLARPPRPWTTWRFAVGPPLTRATAEQWVCEVRQNPGPKARAAPGPGVCGGRTDGQTGRLVLGPDPQGSEDGEKAGPGRLHGLAAASASAPAASAAAARGEGLAAPLTMAVVEIITAGRPSGTPPGDLTADPRRDAVLAVGIVVWDERADGVHLATTIAGSCDAASQEAVNIAGALDCRLFAWAGDGAVSSKLFPGGSHAAWPGGVVACADESSTLRAIADVVATVDPDVVMGFDTERESLGYLLDRGVAIGVDMARLLSRLPGAGTVVPAGAEGIPSPPAAPADNVVEAIEVQSAQLASGEEAGKAFPASRRATRPRLITGRVVFDIWQASQQELKLPLYTLQAVCRAALGVRLPQPQSSMATAWTREGGAPRMRAAEWLARKTLAVVGIVEALEIVRRSAQQAAVLGIDLASVRSRGSQLRVESALARLARCRGFVLLSPSKPATASQTPQTAIPLIRQPHGKLYMDPVVVLDFRSLYPSLIIAHNLCYSTILGTVDGLEKTAAALNSGLPAPPTTLGAAEYVVDVDAVANLVARDDVFVAPNGTAFAACSGPRTARGILPRMLMEVLDARLHAKRDLARTKARMGAGQGGAMGPDAVRARQRCRALDATQLCLKLLANVTYGYASAAFSGRMPCNALADAIVSLGEATLRRAHAAVVQVAGCEDAEVVYGDTDSLFVRLPGRTRAAAFQAGRRMARAVTAQEPWPVCFELEKVSASPSPPQPEGAITATPVPLPVSRRSTTRASL